MKTSLPEPVSAIVRMVWERLTIKLILGGIALILAGSLAGNSIWAGLLPLWGAGLVTLGTVFHLVIWHIRRPSRDRGD